jgi:hypothetical protein
VSTAESQRLFSAAVLLAAENKLFSAAGHWSPKIKAYFRLIFSSGQEPPKISLRPPKISGGLRLIFGGSWPLKMLVVVVVTIGIDGFAECLKHLAKP